MRVLTDLSHQMYPEDQAGMARGAFVIHTLLVESTGTMNAFAC